jgi:aryl-alcohol dehydrogenase-like predicted oxidoreductase
MKIILGAAQFGLDYGISNMHGKTTIQEAKKILQYAYSNDIEMIDTAIQYGNSENVIGHSIDKGDNWKIVTKTINFSGDCINQGHIKQLKDSLNKSLLNLGESNLYGLLIHSCDNIFLPGGERLFKTMEAMKDEGFINKIGVSVYSSEQINRVLDNYAIDLIQLPISILDQRLINDGSLARLKEHNVEIHARSVFLQGLILMQPNNVHPWFSAISGELNDFHMEAARRNMTALQLALGFVQSIKEIDRIVVGVSTLEQLYEIIDAKLVRVDINNLSNLAINNPKFLNPSNWKI